MPVGLQLINAQNQVVYDPGRRLPRIIYTFTSPPTFSYPNGLIVPVPDLTNQIGTGQMWFYSHSNRASPADADAVSSCLVQKAAGDNVMIYNYKNASGQYVYDGSGDRDYPYTIYIGVR